MRTADVFERLAGRYDAWYEGPAGATVFPAEALGVEAGLDPAAAPLAIARSRGIGVVRGAGERLPFRSGMFGAVLIVVTVCFADDPAALLAEARRVIRDDGAVVLGEVFAESAWGRFYQRKGAEGHPFYAAARFLTRDQTLTLVTAAGLRVAAARSALSSWARGVSEGSPATARPPGAPRYTSVRATCRRRTRPRCPAGCRSTRRAPRCRHSRR